MIRCEGLVFAYLLPWLDYYLKGDCAGGSQFQALIAAGGGITSQQNCTLACTPSAIEESRNPGAWKRRIIQQYKCGRERVRFRLRNPRGLNMNLLKPFNPLCAVGPAQIYPAVVNPRL